MNLYKALISFSYTGLSLISIISDELQSVDDSLSSIIFQNKNFLTHTFSDFILNNSKKIRSAITILFLKALFGSVSPSQIRICAITELFHNASLIHDDIVDDAPFRRGKPSFNSLFDYKTALLAGDFLLASALSQLSLFNNISIINLFSNAFLFICDGELNQLSQKNNLISIEEYIDKSEKKTAQLFKINLLSALILENQLDFISCADYFTKFFGIAFQIRNDIDDIYSNSNVSSLSIDLKNGVYTAPVIFFLQNNHNISDISINQLNNCEILAKSNDLCSLYCNKAIELLLDFPDNIYTKNLIALCELLKQG